MSEKKSKKPVKPAAEGPAPETEAKTETAAQEAEAEKAETDSPAAETEEQKIARLLAETNDRLLRTLAEYDNFRKRSQKEKDALYGDGKADAVKTILPVLDNLERASASDGDYESYKKGVELTVKQLGDALTGLGLECFGAAGDPFDPNLHNGVMHEDNPDLPENTVAEVFLKGYKLGDKVIRYATVKVAN